jgi:hypothetical protein
MMWRVWLALILLCAAGVSAADDCVPERRALLIGINDYIARSLPDLRGAVNDVQLLKRILVTRFGFPEENIVLLTDREATRARMLTEIDRFVDGGCPDDIVYFHYSGHGSQVRDLNGDEEDGMDETILPRDGRTSGVPDIRDDELDQRFARLKARNALIVFDSCNSGTVTRSATAVQARFVPPDDRLELYRDANLQTRAVVPVEDLPHVLMTSAPADKEALDGPLDEGFYGLFSFSLARSLDTQGPTATPAQILNGAKTELRRIQEQLYTRPPEPQLEGPPEKLERPILRAAGAEDANGGAPPPRRAWLDVVPISPDQVRLVDGVVLNARPGSQWAIYPAGEVRFAYGDAQAIGIVTETAAADSILRVRSARAPVEAGARAIALAPPDVSAEQPVHIEGVSPARRDAIQRLVAAETPAVRFVAPGEFARLIVRLDGGRWDIFDAAGLQLALSFSDLPDLEVARRVAQVITWSSRATSLLSLDNPAADIKLRVGVRTAFSSSRPPVTQRGLLRVSDDPVPTYRIRRDNEQRTPANSLSLEIRADRPVFLTIASVDTEGQIQLLFPNAYQRDGFLTDGRIPGGMTVRIPDSLDAGNRAGFHWDYGPPVGKDTIRVFATEDLVTANTIRKFIGQSNQAPERLPDLRAVLAETAVRGIRVVPDRPEAGGVAGDAPPAARGEWAAASVTIQVTE